MNTQISSQSHEYAADGRTIVDDGSSDYQVTKLAYDAGAAASATAYSADKQKSMGANGAGTGALSNTAALAGARRGQASAQSSQQMKAQAFQQQMQSKFGREKQSQLR